MKVAIQTKFKETDIGPIPTKWDLKPLKDLTTKIGSGATPRGGNDAYIDNGPYALIRSQNVYDDRFEYNGLAHINDEQAAELSNVEVKEGDVLLNITGASLGRANIVPKNILPARVNQHVAILRSNGRLDPHFLKGWLHLPQVKSYILGHNAGGTREAITKEMIENFVLPVPPLSEQKQIAEILSSLDDKIELNRAINSNLEKLASAIFKKWFVDIGDELSEGWRIGKVANVCEFNPSYSLPKGKSAPYVEMKDLPEREASIRNFILRPFMSGSKFTNGDTLLARITPCLENGKTAFVDFLRESEIGWGSTEFIVMHPREEEFSEFLYLLARSESFRGHAIQSMSGSSGRQRVQVDTVADYQLTIPERNKVREFHGLAKPIFEEIRSNTSQSRALAGLRHSLLPRLMSGRIRVN